MPSSFCIRGLAVATLLLAGCSEDTPAPVPDAPLAASLPGVWTGTFPCENCSGIDTQLVLRPDGIFLFAQTDAPAAEDVPKPVTAYSLGHWSWDPGARLLTLSGRGPSRVFARPAADELVMQTASPLEHRLAKRNRTPVLGCTAESVDDWNPG